MTNPTRTRAEIQAEQYYTYYLPVNVFDQKCEWLGVKTYAGGTLFPLTFQVHESRLIPESDLIRRAEHEAALAEAKEVTSWNSALDYILQAMDNNEISGNLLKHHNGHTYRVTVERVDAETPASEPDYIHRLNEIAKSVDISSEPYCVSHGGGDNKLNWDFQVWLDGQTPVVVGHPAPSSADAEPVGALKVGDEVFLRATYDGDEIIYDGRKLLRLEYRYKGSNSLVWADEDQVVRRPAPSQSDAKPNCRDILESAISAIEPNVNHSIHRGEVAGRRYELHTWRGSEKKCPNCAPQAVAPVGVVEELRGLIRALGDEADSDITDSWTRCAIKLLDGITELPEPSERDLQTALAVEMMIEMGNLADKTTPEGVAAALLAKEATHD